MPPPGGQIHLDRVVGRDERAAVSFDLDHDRGADGQARSTTRQAPVTTPFACSSVACLRRRWGGAARRRSRARSDRASWSSSTIRSPTAKSTRRRRVAAPCEDARHEHGRRTVPWRAEHAAGDHRCTTAQQRMEERRRRAAQSRAGRRRQRATSGARAGPRARGQAVHEHVVPRGERVRGTTPARESGNAHDERVERRRSRATVQRYPRAAPPKPATRETPQFGARLRMRHKLKAQPSCWTMAIACAMPARPGHREAADIRGLRRHQAQASVGCGHASSSGEGAAMRERRPHATGAFPREQDAARSRRSAWGVPCERTS